ncbi:MAG: hypothetical protein FD124_1252 [Alphaproteobacteria bacterium]|nr:MAG: hypothetical protein FD124_1252 [Alphaproteobacteria bacterium]
MDYKAQFQPLELLRGGAWRAFEDSGLADPTGEDFYVQED